jgi:hypothetical protein
VRLPNNTFIRSQKVGHLPIKGLSRTATETHVFDDLKNASLTLVISDRIIAISWIILEDCRKKGPIAKVVGGKCWQVLASVKNERKNKETIFAHQSYWLKNINYAHYQVLCMYLSRLPDSLSSITNHRNKGLLLEY